VKRVLSFTLFLLILSSTLAWPAEMHFFAGAGLRQPVETLVEDFQKKTGHRVNVDYDGSGRLSARIIASGRGDLFMPGSLFYVERLQAEGKIHSWRPVVAHTPVIAVNQSKADWVAVIEDLAKPGIRLALGDPKAMALGKTAVMILDRAGLKEEVLPNVVVYGATVKQLALYVAEGNVDASIIARADAFQFRDRVHMIPIPEEYLEVETVPVAVLTTATDPEAAVALRDFLSSPEAIRVFESFGFLPLK
jgi:molybdate transport system substrate-binding protein